MAERQTKQTPEYVPYVAQNYENLRLPRPLQKLRESLSQREKMVILMVVGFTLVFALISFFAVAQFKQVMYKPAERRVEKTFQATQVRDGLEPAPGMDYTDELRVSLDLKQDVVEMKKYRGEWYFFKSHDDQLAYLNVTPQYQLLEKISYRLLWIFGLSEIALLLMAMALTRANMRPILRASHQQKTFIADAAHEFKTPMTIMQNNLERMLEHPNDTVMDQVENIANSLTEVRHLNHLTSDLLTLAQSDASVPMFEFDEINVTEVAREVGDVYKLNADSKQQTLTIDMPDELLLTGDAQRMRQLLVILIDNAQKYAGEGARVTVSGEKKKDMIKLTVADTGKGVTDEQKKRLFDRFYRIDKARSRSTGGHGLGLSIAKWVVQGHHGTITVTDTDPQGTTFTMMLPITQKKARS